MPGGLLSNTVFGEDERREGANPHEQPSASPTLNITLT
jgi:hypothetical protein